MKSTSDGSTASYYELPEGCRELQDLISHRDMNSQIGEIFRACYRYGIASHSDRLRDAKKIKFYAEAEIKRLQLLEQQRDGWTPEAIKEAAFPLTYTQGCRASYCETMNFGSSPVDQSATNTDQSESETAKPGWDDAPEWATHLMERLGAYAFGMKVGDTFYTSQKAICSFCTEPDMYASGNSNPWRVVEPRPISPSELAWQYAPDQATHLLMNGKERKFAMQDGGVYRDCHTQYVIDMADWPIIVGR
jgi:hypothetical protein